MPLNLSDPIKQFKLNLFYYVSRKGYGSSILFLRIETSKRQKVKTSKSQNVEKSKRRKVKTSKSENVEKSKRRKVKTSKSQIVKTSKLRNVGMLERWNFKTSKRWSVVTSKGFTKIHFTILPFNYLEARYVPSMTPLALRKLKHLICYAHYIFLRFVLIGWFRCSPHNNHRNVSLLRTKDLTQFILLVSVFNSIRSHFNKKVKLLKMKKKI